MTDKLDSKTDKTIRDFGDQWTRYTENSGHYASLDLLKDIVEPLISLDDLSSANCAEIGAGTGRISELLVQAGAAHVTAVEPSRAYSVLEENLSKYGDRVECVNSLGSDIELTDLDFVLSIGVLHHIPDPKSTVEAMYGALKPGGKAVVWLYGKEGNELYLKFVSPLRAVTSKLPVFANSLIAWIMYVPLVIYLQACKLFNLPMRRYFLEVIQPLDGKDIRLIIIDQINPEWAKYYTQEEAEQLLKSAGFAGVETHHRHGYSWTVVGSKRSGTASND